MKHYRKICRTSHYEYKEEEDGKRRRRRREKPTYKWKTHIKSIKEDNPLGRTRMHIRFWWESKKEGDH
jgi:hypothetical protein